MDVESQPAIKEEQQPPRRHTSRGAKLAVTVLNLLVLVVGGTSGPLVLRLYYIHGGRRQWLSSGLETAGCPILFLPLLLSYLHRRRNSAASGGGPAQLIFITPQIFLACAGLGLLFGLVDFLYAYGLAFVPVSTSSLLISSQLVFTALFTFLIVRQRFTPYSLNAVALLTVGGIMLGLHASSDRPPGVSYGQYLMGFLLTLGSAALYGLLLPLIELIYKKATQAITYTLVIEMQLVMGFFATGLCIVGMLVNRDFQAIPKEARNYELGAVKYYTVLVSSAILWQMNFLGLVGVIFRVNTLFAGVVAAMVIPVIEVLAVIFFHEKFSSEKGVSLALSLWGLASYSYGEFRASKAVADINNVTT